MGTRTFVPVKGGPPRQARAGMRSRVPEPTTAASATRYAKTIPRPELVHLDGNKGTSKPVWRHVSGDADAHALLDIHVLSSLNFPLSACPVSFYVSAVGSRLQPYQLALHCRHRVLCPRRWIIRGLRISTNRLLNGTRRLVRVPRVAATHNVKKHRHENTTPTRILKSAADLSSTPPGSDNWATTCSHKVSAT